MLTKYDRGLEYGSLFALTKDDVQVSLRNEDVMKKRLVVLVAFVLLLPCLALAGGVSFTTSGTLSNPALFPITFEGFSASDFVGGNISFGEFTVTPCSHAVCSGSETFTLQISQSSPTAGTIDLVGTLSGSVLGDGQTHLTLTFTSPTVSIGPIIYNVKFPASINMGFTTLNGTVTGVPEPSAEFLLGMGALGLMGLATVCRKSMISA